MHVENPVYSIPAPSRQSGPDRTAASTEARFSSVIGVGNSLLSQIRQVLMAGTLPTFYGFKAG
jgi:hypothetical protein